MKTQKHLLFCPGPVNTADNVRDALISYEIGHREKEFEAIFKKLQSKILRAFEIRNRKAYTPIIVTGSGSAANEAVISSIVGKKNILVLSNGEFGERLFHMSSLHNKNTYTVKFEWGETMNLAEIEKAIIKHKIQVIAMTHHETCSGKINPINEIGELTKKYGITFFVDTVSGAGADKLEIEKANIAFVSTSASKALGSVPGLAIVIGKNEEFEAIKDHAPKTMYLNLYKFYHYAALNQTPNTPAVQLFFALEAAVDNIVRKGPVLYRKEIHDRAVMIRTEMKRLGLKFLIDEAEMSNSLTTVYLPEKMSFQKLAKALRKHNIIIYNGKGPFLNKVFQVANIGELSQKDVKFFLKVFKNAVSPKKVQKGMVIGLPEMVLPNIMPQPVNAGYQVSLMGPVKRLYSSLKS